MLVAGALSSCQEILALVSEERRPDARVGTVASREIDGEVICYAPCFIVCGGCTPGARTTARSWVHILPPELRDAAVCVGLRHHSRIKDLGTDDLPAVVDLARRLTPGI